ncbi:MAG: tetratricopeptide repeat protein [Saprospiraceae bacterium]|nr:tetratricopeptide repeat protein [Saprospiraceae bacterium]
MPHADFNAKYNGGQSTNRIGLFKHVTKGRHAKKPASKRLKKSASKSNKGNRHLAAGRYEEAIRSFDSALDINESDEDAHHQLAAFFSMLKDAYNAYFHLAEAVKYGFSDFKKIDSDINLYFLRTHPLYSEFRIRGYKVVIELPEPREDLLDSERLDPSILEKIEQLGSLYENGQMSLQVFQLQKEQILKRG